MKSALRRGSTLALVAATQAAATLLAAGTARAEAAASTPQAQVGVDVE